MPYLYRSCCQFAFLARLAPSAAAPIVRGQRRGAKLEHAPALCYHREP